MAAPVTAIIAWDTEFTSIFPALSSGRLAPTCRKQPLIEENAVRTVTSAHTSFWPHAFGIRLRTNVRFRR